MKNNIIKVVVVGGGFAGLNFIKKLSKDRRFHITLVDKNNYHAFSPLLYQVASAFIESSNISYPFRRMFQKKDNFRFHMGTLERVVPQKNIIETNTGAVPYDFLILASGTKPNYFGLKNVEENAWPMKTVNDALNLRNHILLSLEKAARAPLPKDRALNIVVAGGGPTGVEISGMLAELGRNLIRKEYPEIKNLRGRIHLIDAAPTLLGPMTKKAQKEAYRVLTRLGVKIQLDAALKDYRNGIVYLSNGNTIATNILIWTSGVIANEVAGLSEDTTTRGRRIIVDQTNKVKGTSNIFAIGDLCFQTSDKRFPKGHPQVAQVAIQQGVTLAGNMKRTASGKQPVPFVYHDKGSMAIISKYKAIADLPKFSFTGYFAWLIWLFIHIIPLIGYRNKAKLAFNWFWSFITNNPTLRLIVRPGKVVEEKELHDSDTLHEMEMVS